MTATSVIDIEVNDAAFLSLKTKFDSFQEGTKQQPQIWSAIDDRIGELAKSMQSLVDIGMAQTAGFEKSAKAEKEMVRQATGAKRLFHDMGKEAASLAKDVGDITKNMLKWVGIGGVFSGLLGAGGLFGLAGLAQAVGAGRRSAQGVGTTSGREKAFDLNYGRYVNAHGLLSNVADARNDFSRRWAFGSLNLSQAASDGTDTADLASQVTASARSKFQHSDKSRQSAEAQGLLQFFSMDELRTLGGISDEEFNKQQAGYKRDASALNLTDPTQRAWQNLAQQLDTAAAKIENVLVKGLTPLAEPLANFSDAIANSIKTLTDSPNLAKWMKQFGDGIEGAAKYIGSEQFQADLTQFEDRLEKVVKGLGTALEWIAKWADPNTGKAVPGQPGLVQTPVGPIGVQVPTGTENKSWWEHLFGNAGHLPWNMPQTPILGNDGKPTAPVGNHANNITNLQYNDKDLYPGEKSDGRFASFDTPEHGASAAIANLVVVQQKYQLKTLEDMILKETPRSDNPNVDGYIDRVATELGIKRTDSVDFSKPDFDYRYLMAVGRQEGTLGGIDSEGVRRGVYGALGAPMPTLGYTDNIPAQRTALQIAGSQFGYGPGQVNKFLNDNGQDINAASTAWCAAFVNASLKAVGITGSGSKVATSFEKWGRAVDLGGVQAGDVLVEDRGHLPGQTGGHVGFATGEHRMDHGRLQYQMLSGNYGNHVDRSWEDADKLAARRAVGPRMGDDPLPQPSVPDQPGAIRRGSPGQQSMNGSPRLTIYNQTGSGFAITGSQLAAVG